MTIPKASFYEGTVTRGILQGLLLVKSSIAADPQPGCCREETQITPLVESLAKKAAITSTASYTSDVLTYTPYAMHTYKLAGHGPSLPSPSR